MTTHRTPGLRFARELDADVEWFKVTSDDINGSQVERHFQAALLKAWLVDEEGLADDEADAFIAQLRQDSRT